MTRVRRSGFNFATNMAFTVVTLVIGLIATPLLLRFLGQERLGAFRAAGDWLGYLTLLELGLGGALLPLISQALAGNESGKLRAVMAAGFASYRWASVMMLAAGIGLALCIGWLVPGTEALRHDLHLAILVAIVGLIFVPLSPLRALCEAEQRGYIVNLALVVQSVVITTLAVLLAWRGWGVTGQMLAVVIGAAVFNAMLVWRTIMRRRAALRWMIDRSDEPSLPERRDLSRLQLPTLSLNFAGRLGLLTDNIVIGYFLGPAAVVPFYLTQRLVQIATGQLQSIGNATWAGLCELRLREGNSVFLQRSLELSRLIVILGIAVMTPIVAYNQSFVTLWVGRPMFGGMTLTLLAVGNGMLLSLISLWGWMFSGTGNVQRLVGPALVSTAVNVAVSISATVWLSRTHPALALIGPVLGTSVAFLTVNSWWIMLRLRDTFDLSPARLAGAVLSPLLIGVPYAMLIAWIARSHTIHGWLGLAIEMALSAGGFLLLAWLLLLSRSERKVWRKRLPGLVGGAPMTNNQPEAIAP